MRMFFPVLPLYSKLGMTCYKGCASTWWGKSRQRVLNAIELALGKGHFMGSIHGNTRTTELFVKRCLLHQSLSTAGLLVLLNRLAHPHKSTSSASVRAAREVFDGFVNQAVGNGTLGLKVYVEPMFHCPWPVPRPASTQCVDIKLTREHVEWGDLSRLAHGASKLVLASTSN